MPCPINIQTGKALRRLEKREDGVALHFEKIRDVAAVIAADGIHSVVRRQLFPSCRQRSSGQVCWRGVCPADTEPWNHRGTALGAWNAFWDCPNRRRAGLLVCSSE
ncbi:MAG: hypothetical protein H6560_20675 [Lewinellaceae bacterium]|nr:hypothetical protein [Lewinellaceae bacterium]